jgi:hypothetical protein
MNRLPYFFKPIRPSQISMDMKEKLVSNGSSQRRSPPVISLMFMKRLYKELT